MGFLSARLRDVAVGRGFTQQPIDHLVLESGGSQTGPPHCEEPKEFGGGPHGSFTVDGLSALLELEQAAYEIAGYLNRPLVVVTVVGPLCVFRST
jgi:hypothetical protein